MGWMLHPPLPLSTVCPGPGEGGSLRTRCRKESWPHPDAALTDKCKANWWDWTKGCSAWRSHSGIQHGVLLRPAPERMLRPRGCAKQTQGAGWGPPSPRSPCPTTAISSWDSCGTSLCLWMYEIFPSISQGEKESPCSAQYPVHLFFLCLSLAQSTMCDVPFSPLPSVWELQIFFYPG